MSNFGLSALALSAVCPTNKLITDDKGLPGAYVQFGQKKLNELLTTENATIHPAFMVSNDEKKTINIGKFQGMAHGNRIYSLPGEDPKAYIDLDTMEQYCRNKGAGHHCITAAEWALLALICKKSGHMPKGNNDYGKDSTETDKVAIPTYVYYDGTIGRVASGVSAFAKLYLQTMALAPEGGGAEAYGGDYFYGNNGAAERCAFRGGYWSNGARYGVFALSFSNPRSNSGNYVGGRSAYIDPAPEG